MFNIQAWAELLWQLNARSIHESDFIRLGLLSFETPEHRMQLSLIIELESRKLMLLPSHNELLTMLV